MLYRLLILCFLAFLIFQPTPGFAQNTVEVTDVFTVSDHAATDGDIVSASSGKGIARASTAYDMNLFGVIQNNSLLIYRRYDNQGVPIARNGVAYVNVTTENGPISAGDLITSSDISGKGQRADKPGYVLGRALEGLKDGQGAQISYQDPTNPKLTRKATIGRVSVALHIEYAQIPLSYFTTGIFAPLSSLSFFQIPSPNSFNQAVRYLLAALLVLSAFMGGLIAFSRAVPKALEAIGRNPLARVSIYISLVLGLMFTIVIIVLGIAIAILILKI